MQGREAAAQRAARPKAAQRAKGERSPGTGERGPDTNRAAFTLIEMLAVVAIFALMASFVMPNLGVFRSRALRHQAERIASLLELARQRSVVTAIPHRVVIDIDAGSYRLEWLVSEDEAGESPAPAESARLDLRGDMPLPLAAPREAQREYRPLPGRLGRRISLEHELAVAGIETPEGWIDRGEVFIAFDRDGTTAYTAIVLDDDSGRTATLDVLPLADAVRIRDET
jgi:prepilin-type N-terminal cleavage/methylation domain-containing protein